MEKDVSAFLGRLARDLRPRSDQWAGLLMEQMRGELPELWQRADLAQRALSETADHVTAFLDALEHGRDVTEAQAPPAALELARGFAEAGVPLSTLLRTYRLGHVGLLQLLQDEVTRFTDDQRLANAATLRLIKTGFAYVDQSSEQVVAAYQEVRDRRVQRRLMITNEASRRIGTTLDTVRTAEELAEVGADGFADLATVDILDSVLQDGEQLPPADAPVLRRVAQRSVLDGCPDSPVATDERHVYAPDSVPAEVLATGRPVLLPVTASDAPPWLASPGPPRFGYHSVLLLPLYARGTTLGLAQFVRHRTPTPFDDDDLLLAQDIAARAALYIDNARRYTHERTTALTLQRSLLPQRPVEQSAVDTAARYLPSGSRAGVGGDWYDVIPLSGGRVALVVGDVVGRGLHAAATMGRLRTAVRAFADIDLMPDELLTHLDDVVIRLQREESREDGEISATCLYAIYDPATRLCSLASAGHVPPAVATSAATPAADTGTTGAAPAEVPKAGTAPADLPALPIGPPLGLGGLPFETAQWELPEGSLLALYTDGLVQSRTRDLDASLTLLSDTLARASQSSASPDEVCERLLATMLPARPSDDVALLVARTRALDPGHVATLDLPSDPAAVSGARRFTADTLGSWGLDELSFTTELIVSELVTNAIRYGKPPVHLRLVLDSALTCEVFDANSTAPHMRRARTFDEGGRGLLLVAQFAERWGTRHGREGKTIWAEQALP
ncbi:MULTISPECIES: SpoIIE family protein phosphatase [unclassified Streptomyces]|uniref:ATP-binding SpoIIE family protein phosphatase n=1 Tax=unclassified Streptomyces TaxID=2593676 RepID=UPI00165611F1|nr:SpoIIE family protein phosphatase [Streptomyces sp. CB02980]MCB8901502.1 SpoIIE family protein phosphatase [Streptomyces sp. CB02980]